MPRAPLLIYGFSFGLMLSTFRSEDECVARSCNHRNPSAQLGSGTREDRQPARPRDRGWAAWSILPPAGQGPPPPPASLPASKGEAEGGAQPLLQPCLVRVLASVVPVKGTHLGSCRDMIAPSLVASH